MIKEVTAAGVTGNKDKVEEALEDALVHLPIGLAEGSDCANVMPEDMATVAIEMFAVAESSIFDAGLVSGNLKVRESVVAAVGVVPVVLTVLVTA